MKLELCDKDHEIYKDLSYHSDEVSFDLDATIAGSNFPKAGIGEAIDGARRAMFYVMSLGFKPVIFTTRPDYERKRIEEWAKDHELPITRVQCGKSFFRLHIDDRAVGFRGDWEKTQKEIKEMLKNAKV